jgi:hypothetical protein
MGKGRKGSERVERLGALLEAGDHGAARRLAAELLADAASSGDERDAAVDVRARTAPDRGVTLAGVCGVAVALAVSFWLIVH